MKTLFTFDFGDDDLGNSRKVSVLFAQNEDDARIIAQAWALKLGYPLTVLKTVRLV